MDVPSNYEDGWMPQLDIQSRVNSEGYVEHKFYKKKIVSKYCIPERSSHSDKMKKATNIQEGVRRLRNCSSNVDWKTRSDILSEWSATLKRSGYDSHYRRSVIMSSIKIFEDIVEKDRKGERPMYRTIEWMESHGHH